ncbi:hypothetical protein M2271_000353 [Streptomyces sp. LBL]|nr:hypothetical protein [Streptomyces sp. LBL]
MSCAGGSINSVRHFHGCYTVGDDTLWGVNHYRRAPGTLWPR